MTRPSLTDDPELVKQAYEIIEESICFYKCLVNRTADAVVWENVVFKKQGGVRILEAMLALEPGKNKKKEIKKNLGYWKTNYDSIRKQVYQCD